MKFLRDRELHVQLLLLLPLTMAAAGVGFSRVPPGRRLALGLCALFALVLLGSAWRRYRTMEALCQDLDRILHGESGVDLDAYDEGAWSILHSQLTKLLTRLREQADRLQGTRIKAAFLADCLPPDPDAPHGPEPSGQPAGRTRLFLRTSAGLPAGSSGSSWTGWTGW